MTYSKPPTSSLPPFNSDSADLELDSLLEGFGKSEGRAAPSTQVSRAIVLECTSKLGPAEGLSRRQRFLACAAGGVVAIAGASILLHGDGVHTLLVGGLYGALGWGLVMLLVLAYGFGAQKPSPLTARVLAAVGTPALFFAYLALSGTHRLPFARFVNDGAHFTAALQCAALAVVLGAMASMTVLYVWRRTDPFNPGISGALAGLAGGLAGASSVGIVCPSGEGWHLWLGHGAATLILAVAGALLGRRLLAP